ncbi:MAG: arylsulfatase [Spirosomaceae bacterium]|jgi:arylsulfatase A-like enzyme|nr:arylsulfatase [Spirosomataceae bacterium]
MSKVFVAATVLLALLGIQSTPKSASSKPNIIFILADDLGYGDLGCFGSKIIKTPHLDQLAADGIRLTQFYSGSTVCAPSRCALMTSKHTGHAYIRGNGEIPLRPTDVTMPQLLQKAGYRTAMFGKWGLGDINTTGSPELKGWDEFVGFLHHVEGHYQLPGIAWQYQPQLTQQTQMQRIRGGGGFACDLFTDSATEFIQRQSAQTPFFVYLPLIIPHAELYAPAEAMKRYRDANGNSIFEETPWEGSHYGSQRMPKAAYCAMVSKADDYVGQIVKILKEKGLYENTLIVFSSDNGTHIEGGRTKADVTLMNSSGGLRGVKRDMTDGGIRVPTIVSGAGLPKNISREGYGAFWDFLPTFLEMAGVEKPQDIDGVSHWQYWKTGQNWQQRPLYWEFYEGGYFQAVRHGDWKYIKSKMKNGTVKEELYNLKSDVGESQNLASSNESQRKQMADLTTSLRSKPEHSLFVLPEDK